MAAEVRAAAAEARAAMAEARAAAAEARLADAGQAMKTLVAEEVAEEEVAEEEEEGVVEEENEVDEEGEEEVEDQEQQQDEEEASVKRADALTGSKKRPREAATKEDGAAFLQWHFRGGFSAHTAAAAAATPNDVGMGHDYLSAVGNDVLSAILRLLPARDVMNLSMCDRRWSYLAEEYFEHRCLARGWRLPRRPRGASATGRLDGMTLMSVVTMWEG